jgi:hypothetical protein
VNAAIVLLLVTTSSAAPSSSAQADPAPTERTAPAAGPEPSSGEPAKASAPSEGSRSEPQQRWSSFLPLLAEEARKRGVELPLPFGVSVVYYHLERAIDVSDVRIGRGGNPPTSVSELAQFSSESRVDNVNLKLDAWLLPFVDLYAFVGWFHNESTTRVRVGIPRPVGPPVERDLQVPTTIDGSVGGLGATLATGYPPFFLVVDVNAFSSDLGFSETLRGSIGSARAGYAGSVAGAPLNAWLSATYWNTRTTVKDQLSDTSLGEITFEADQGPRWAWTYGVGANARVHPHFEVFSEIGVDFHGGWYFVLGPTGRL